MSTAQVEKEERVMRKDLKTALYAAGLTMLMGTTAYGGQWQQDRENWRWQEDDGSFAANRWRWLDGNGDGISECYYFGQDGYLYVNTVTPDGYTVDENGAWVHDSTVQTQDGQAMAEAERYTVIGGPNRLVSPNGLQGIIPFDMNLYQEFKSGQDSLGSYDYEFSIFYVTRYQYTYGGEKFDLGFDSPGGNYFPGKWVVDNTKPDAVNGKTNIRYMYDDGTFAGYGFHTLLASEEWAAESKALKAAEDPDYLKYSGRAETFFSEDGYMYRNCYIGTTSTKMGYDGGWIDRDYN